jgi:hypothetical protein
MNLYTLQKVSTLKSPTMTQLYAHLCDQAIRKAADIPGNLIEQLTNGKETRRPINRKR